MLSGDDMHVWAIGIGVIVGSTCVGSRLVIWVQVCWDERCASGSTIIGIEFCGNAKIVKTLEEVDCRK